MTDQVSFNQLEKNLEQAKINAGSYSNPEIILVGTKSDVVKRVVEYETAKKYADLLGCQYIETSAKAGLNVDKVFTQIAEQIAAKEDALKQQKDNEKAPLLQGNGASNWSAGPGFLAPPTRDKDANNEENCCLKSCVIL